MIQPRAGHLVLLGLGLALTGCFGSSDGWSEKDKARIIALSLQSLPPLPPDPSNAVADNVLAVQLGSKLFFDRALSANGQVACASCHQPENGFQDSLPRAQAIGTNNRRTMPLAGTAYSPWLFWDGRKDSQWSQALGPLENPVEHGTDRTTVARHVIGEYGDLYQALFGPPPSTTAWPQMASPATGGFAFANWQALPAAEQTAINRVFANAGKAIAAFERKLMPQETRFDRYALKLAGKDTAGEAGLSDSERRGLALFIGKGNCVNCHNGPLLSDNHFHNTGVPPVEGLPPDEGRIAAIQQVLDDPFNCLGPYSDARPEACQELTFMKRKGEELVRAYKPPSLRGVASRAPYMHAGQLASLDDVINHYDAAPASTAGGHTELVKLGLAAQDKLDLIAFLKTLEPDPAKP